ncbi:MAG: hypothetical protein R2909_08390 [Gemmatimonadales bacterium]
MRHAFPLAALAALLLASDLGAQTDRGREADCPTRTAPSDLAGWADRTPLTAAATERGLDGAVIALGRAVDATLHPTAAVEYAVAPERPAENGHGGLFAFDVATAGRYGVAVGSAAWVDVIEDGRLLGSAGHARGAACSEVHKTVIFALRAGRHLLQVSGNDGPATILLIRSVP